MSLPPPEAVPHTRKLTTTSSSSQTAANIDRHVQSLGQKYMGYRPSSIYQDTSVKPEGGHNVLVDNFLNAQCKQIVSTPTMNPLPVHPQPSVNHNLSALTNSI